MKPSPFQFWSLRVLSVVLAVTASLGIGMLEPVLPQYRIVILAGVYITLAVSLNLINGITGQFSIGHAGFFMVGAYSTGILTQAFYQAQPLDKTSWLVVMMVAGAAFAGFTGLVVGLPSLRLRGDYLAIVTLGFGEIIRSIAINTPALGGAYGLKFAPKIQEPWLIWLLAILCVAVCRNLLTNAHGLPFLAVREDEVASGAMGVNTTNVKVSAFVIGSAFAGAAGALLGHYEGFLSPDMFRMDVSFMILTMVVLGGSGSITGSALAAVALIALPEFLRNLPNKVSMGHILGVVIAIIAFVVFCRMVKMKFHGTQKQRAGAFAGVTVGSIVAAIILAMVLNQVPFLSAPNYDFNNLRMSIFATVLIVVMLIRPEGVLGNAEFSWQMFRRRKTEEAPA
jgi:branched-chain amino acid transport system permease protein